MCWPAGPSTSAGPSSSATSCSARWAARRPQDGDRRLGTDSDVLETLAEQGVELARKVLDWRQLTKLKSTYADALPDHINPRHGPRPHQLRTGLDLDRAAFLVRAQSAEHSGAHGGRAAHPHRLRRAAGRQLVSADYSQIELRVLAHIADIPQLRHAFAEGLDIHAMTAAKCSACPSRAWTRWSAAAPRRSISASSTASRPSAWRTSSASGARKRANISELFRAFPGHPRLMDETNRLPRARLCRDDLRAQMHFPRSPRRIPPSAPSRARRDQCADPGLCRRHHPPRHGAHARGPGRAGLASRMLLQVHDELVFESSQAEVEATMRLARDIMEKAPEPALRFGVPIQVDVRAARNWEEAH